MTQKVSKSQFKPHALEYFRKIQETGQELIITDRGKPVLKISAYVKNATLLLKSLRKTVVRFDDPLEPTGEKWEVLQ